MTALILVRELVQLVTFLATMLVLASVILSWIRPNPYHPAVRFVRNTTEPAYALVRRYLPFLQAGMVDFTPIVLLLLIDLVGKLLVDLIERIALVAT